MPSRRQQPMAVIGAGSWGTALAIQLARAGIPARLWGRDTGQMHAMQLARCNERYLPDAAFPAALFCLLLLPLSGIVFGIGEGNTGNVVFGF